MDQLPVMLRPLGEASFSPLAEAGPGTQCSLSVSGLFLKVKRCEQDRDWMAALVTEGDHRETAKWLGIHGLALSLPDSAIKLGNYSQLLNL